MHIPHFSVIIPTYQRKEFLKTAVDSVLKQSFKDFELIVVDDGSTDGTKEMLCAISDKRLRCTHQEHKGAAAARNQGLEHARAAYICFLDSDDRFKPKKLEVTYQYTRKYPDIEIFHTEELWYRNAELLNQKKIHKKPDGEVFANALKLCCISISTAAIKKEVFDNIGNFDEAMPACEDYDFWLRASAVYPVKLIPEVLTLKEGGHPGQLSQKYPAMDKFRIYAIDKLLRSSFLTDAQKKLAVKELFRKCKIYIKGAEKRQKHKDVKFYTELMDSYWHDSAATI